MRTACVVCLALLFGCETGARSERPAAAPDASAPAGAHVKPPDPSPPPPTSAPEAASTDTLPSAPTPAAPEATPGRPCRVALIGDSLTETRVGGGYVRYLEQRSPNSRFVNFAKGGAMVNQMKRQLEALRADTETAFSHLVVFGGVNDLYSDETAGRTVTKIERDLGELYAGGRERGLRVVGITVAPWSGFNKWYTPRRGAATRELNAWILAGPTRGDSDVAIDAYALLSCGDPERLCPRYALPKSDGLHFGKLGHEALGRALYDAEFHRCS